MWFVDRSRYLAGVDDCEMARYLEYHSGPYGYGIRRTANSMTALTGTYTDQALTGVLLNAAAAQQAGTDIGDPHNDVFRKIVGQAVTDYQTEVKAKGFLEEQNITNLTHTMMEQSALIEGLFWSWVLGQLPGLLRDHTIIAVQQEESYVIPGTCTCGMDADNPKYYDHMEHSNCNGICIMSKPDFLTRRKADNRVCQHDFKTSGSQINDNYLESHRDSVQMAIQSLGVEARMGEPIAQYYIHALAKGGRGVFSKRGQDTTGMPKKQYSDLCYAKWMLPNPPISDKTIVDYKGFWYDKHPSWEANFPDVPPGWRPMEYWVVLMPKDILYAQTVLCGPYDRPTHMMNDAVEHVLGEERRWIAALWKIHEGESVNLHVSRSYDCHKYGAEHRCQYYQICFKGQGWNDPLNSGYYELRVPHHDPELQQMVARGVPFEEKKNA